MQQQLLGCAADESAASVWLILETALSLHNHFSTPNLREKVWPTTGWLSPCHEGPRSLQKALNMNSQTLVASASDPYFSRRLQHEEIVDRQDPVLWKEESPGPLEPEELRNFERDGYLFLPRLFSEQEVSNCLEHARQLAESWPEERPGLIREPDSQAVRSLFRLHMYSDFLQKLFRDRRLFGPVEQILGSQVYVHQSRINYKPALDGREFFWHSDFETWHVEDGMPSMRAVSVSLLLTESHEFNGPLMLIPGSHRKYVRCVGKTPANHYEQSLRRQQFGVPTGSALQQLVEAGGMVAPKGPAGSVILFDCNTMHGSASNLSPTPRSNLFAVYNSVDNALRQPFGDQPPRPDYLAERFVEPIE